MNLNTKLKEIQEKPEHIRIRYVYGALTISMIFIILIWIFSIKDMFRSSSDESNKKPFSTLQENFKESLSKEEDPSLEKLLEENSQKIKEEMELQAKKNTLNNAPSELMTPQEKQQPTESVVQPEPTNITE